MPTPANAENKLLKAQATRKVKGLTNDGFKKESDVT
jgi:hypothetical protein